MAFGSANLSNVTTMTSAIHVQTTQTAGNATFDGSSEMSAFLQALFIVLFSAITLVGLTGNLIVCFTIVANQRMRTVTNYFILNLACSDFLMAVVCVPFGFVSNVLLPYWPFGAALCPLVTCAQTATVFLSAFTLVAISFDRYVAIIFPLKLRRLRTSHAIIIIAVIWLLALSVSLPVAIVSRLMPYVDDLVLCDENWGENQNHRRYYTTFIMVLQYFVPLGVLLVTYTHIGFVVWLKKTPGEAESSRDQRLLLGKRKMIKMMITVVIIYAIFWLPLHVITMLFDDKDSPIWGLSFARYLWIACYWLAMSTCCYNPIVYCWMNTKYRNGFRYAFQFFPCVIYDRERHDPNRVNRIRTYVSSKKSSACSLVSTQRRSGEPPSAAAHLCPRTMQRLRPNESVALNSLQQQLVPSAGGLQRGLYTFLEPPSKQERRFSQMSGLDYTDDDD